MTNVLQIKREDEEKKELDDLFSALGLTTATATRLFYKQALNQNKLPFEVVLSKDEIRKRTVEREILEALATGKRYQSAKDMHEDILNERD